MLKIAQAMHQGESSGLKSKGLEFLDKSYRTLWSKERTGFYNYGHMAD